MDQSTTDFLFGADTVAEFQAAQPSSGPLHDKRFQIAICPGMMFESLPVSLRILSIVPPDYMY